MSDDTLPTHAGVVADAVLPLGAMAIASPGTVHVTVVHLAWQAEAVDAAIARNGLRGERIDSTRVRVFGS